MDSFVISLVKILAQDYYYYFKIAIMVRKILSLNIITINDFKISQFTFDLCI